MIGRWDDLHQDRIPFPYGDTTTYERAWEWLKGCSLVEDWGCGPGWSRRYFRAGQWRGIDGSFSPAVSEIIDLRDYRSQVPGILMRHVLEHNLDWERILDNALASFIERMVLVIFTPMAATTQSLAWNNELNVPDIAFSTLDLELHFPAGVSFHLEHLNTQSQYGVERVYYLEKDHGQP